MTAKTKIALYHGPVYGAKTDTRYMISSRHVEVSKFDGFDIAMLGDIHTHQVMQRRNKSKNLPRTAFDRDFQPEAKCTRTGSCWVWPKPECSAAPTRKSGIARRTIPHVLR